MCTRSTAAPPLWRWSASTAEVVASDYSIRCCYNTNFLLYGIFHLKLLFIGRWIDIRAVPVIAHSFFE